MDVSKRLSFFFFQAEDGIRDRSPSRGLGDVYKRQREDELLNNLDILEKYTDYSPWTVAEIVNDYSETDWQDGVERAGEGFAGLVKQATGVDVQVFNKPIDEFFNGMSWGYKERQIDLGQDIIPQDLFRVFAFEDFVYIVEAISSWNADIASLALKDMNVIFEKFRERFPDYIKAYQLKEAIDTLVELTENQEKLHSVQVNMVTQDGLTFEQNLYDLCENLLKYKMWKGAGRILGAMLRQIHIDWIRGKKLGDNKYIGVSATKFILRDDDMDNLHVKLFLKFALLGINEGALGADTNDIVEAARPHTFKFALFINHASLINPEFYQADPDSLEETLQTMVTLLQEFDKELDERRVKKTEGYNNLINQGKALFGDLKYFERRFKEGVRDDLNITYYSESIADFALRKRYAISGLLFGRFILNLNAHRESRTITKVPEIYPECLDDGHFTDGLGVEKTRLFLAEFLTQSFFKISEKIEPIFLAHFIETVNEEIDLEIIQNNIVKLVDFSQSAMEDTNTAFEHLQRILFRVKGMLENLQLPEELRGDEHTKIVISLCLNIFEDFNRYYQKLKKFGIPELFRDKAQGIAQNLAQKDYANAGAHLFEFFNIIGETMQASEEIGKIWPSLNTDGPDAPETTNTAILDLILKGVYEEFMLPDPKSLEKCLHKNADQLLELIENSVKSSSILSYLNDKSTISNEMWKIIESHLDDDVRACFEDNVDLGKIRKVLKKKADGKKDKKDSNSDSSALFKEAKELYQDEYYEDFGKKIGQILNEYGVDEQNFRT
eukprot:TRINITY_DN592_c0_g1_i9.p1 TRINITY_DN592_c0_g1~~TRINITY_DN592_c0_g1_i9.p1  ORF type:complete len:782 (+),score=272.66 TRINITY_DN592_c0_g1_i9:9-2354(+)